MGRLWMCVVVATLSAGTVLASNGPAGAEDPSALPRVVPGGATQVEGDAGSTTLEIPVALSSPSTQSVSASWATVFGPGIQPPAPATPGVDYDASSGTIEFAPGETEQVIAISVTGDTEAEDDEWVVVRLGPPTNAVPGGYYGLGFGVIADDDTLPRVVPGVAAQPEGDAGTSTISIPVTLSKPSTRVVSAPWATVFGPGIEPPASATPGVDHTASSGTVTFQPGETLASVSIPTFGDVTSEPDEYIVIALGRPTNGVVGGYYGLGFGILEDDDPPPLRTLSVSPDSGIAGGDTVTVAGTGWTPNASVGLCQAVDDATLSPPQSACLAGTGNLTTVATDSNGSFSLSWDLYRWGYVSGLDQWIDCGGPSSSPGCVIGAGEVADLGSTVVATERLGWAIPSPPAQRGTIGVSPSTGLDLGSTVTVTGAGFRPGRVIDVYECQVEPTFGSPSGCYSDSRIRTTADGSGAFSVPFLVTRTEAGFVTAAEAADFVNTYVAKPITFAPTAAVP